VSPGADQLFSDIEDQPPAPSAPVVSWNDDESDLETEQEAPVPFVDVIMAALAPPEAPVVEVAKKPKAKAEPKPIGRPSTDGSVEKFYSSAEVAKHFFKKSTQWLYWGMRTEDPEGNPITPVFVYPDGTLIEPLQIGKGKRRRYTLPVIKEMAQACYRRGNLKEPEFRQVLARIEAAYRDELVATG
jgi:hypothetical protein